MPKTENKINSFFALCTGVLPQHVQAVLTFPKHRSHKASGDYYAVRQQLCAFSADPKDPTAIFVKFERQVLRSTVVTCLRGKDIKVVELCPCVFYMEHAKEGQITEQQARARLATLVKESGGAYTLIEPSTAVEDDGPAHSLPLAFARHPSGQAAQRQIEAGGAPAATQYIEACKRLHEDNQKWLDEMGRALLGQAQGASAAGGDAAAASKKACLDFLVHQ